MEPWAAELEKQKIPLPLDMHICHVRPEDGCSRCLTTNGEDFKVHTTLKSETPGIIRQFSTGATRDTVAGKNQYEGYLSPLVLEAYGDYMTEHRKQSDGSLRDSDNWQKGMPIQVYRDSLIRHVFTAWKLWRGWPVKEEKIGGVMRQPTLLEALNGILFNTMGMMHEILKEQVKKAA